MRISRLRYTAITKLRERNCTVTKEAALHHAKPPGNKAISVLARIPHYRLELRPASRKICTAKLGLFTC
jgi:hypothetical protein